MSQQATITMRPERWIVLGTVATALGIVLCITDTGLAGPTVTMAGFFALILGVHRLGRSGPEE